jgi:hypothetical protein
VYKKRKMSFEYFSVEEGIISGRMELRKESHIVSPGGDKVVQ